MQHLRRGIAYVMDTLETVVFVGSLFMVVYMFIGQPTEVQGASMEPNFHTGDRVILSKITYKFRPMERGDVIILRASTNPDLLLIKRLIGLPGDTVLISEGRVSVNGKQLEESGYLASATPVWDYGAINEDVPFTVPRDYVFVMGDNRPRSSDSREFGPVPIASILGNAVYRLSPAAVIGGIDNPLPADERR